MTYQRNEIDDGASSIILQLVVVNIIIFTLQKVSNHALTEILALPVLRWYEPWRWFTYMFCHGDFWHLFLNLWSLLIFGPLVEHGLGAKRFLRLYFASGLLGAACWLPLNLLAFDMGHMRVAPSVVGASGAIFGVMAAAAVLYPNHEIYLIFPPVPIKIRIAVFCWAGLELLHLMQTNDNVAHLAHLGGFAGGYYLARRAGRRSMSPATRVVTSPKDEPPSRPALHRCEVCGVTEHDDRTLDFRVCSQCSGGKEYCLNHLRTHEHS